jgi:TatD DNase family protein
MKLVDAHCHLESEEFGDALPAVVADARRVGVAGFITCAVTPEGWVKSRAVASQFSEVHFAMGVHPWYVEERHLTLVDGLGEAGERGACAIGEIGLDRKIGEPPFALQQAAFERQLSIAKSVHLPIVIHCRGAFDDLIRLLRAVGPPQAGGIVHAFSGSVELAEVLIELGLSFSLGGALTYRNSRKRQRVLDRIYPDHFLLETDSPDLAPVEAQGRPNTPANILYNLRAAAEILGVPAEDVADATTRNAVRIFGLDV